MIPILYDSTETVFTSNGLGRLRDVIRLEVFEERNGQFEAEFDYPVSGAHFDQIRPGRIIAVTHDDTGELEPFDIVSYSKPISGVVTFRAVHISYRLSHICAWNRNINSLTDALTWINGVDSPFTFTADFTRNGYMAAADGVPRTIRQLLGGIEGSILDTYGGEYRFRGWNVTLSKARGTTRDLTIRYGVNMLDYTEEADFQATYTSAIPYWTGLDGAKQVVVRGSRVDSGLAPYNGRRQTTPLDLTDKFEDKPTAADLESMAAAYMTGNQTNLPSQNIAVDFFRLQEDPQFEDLAGLFTCRLCDTIKVEFPMYGTSGQYKIVKVTWDALAERYSSMELGNLSTSLAEALGISEAAGSYATTDDLAVGGDLTVAGDLYIGGHQTPVGYQTQEFSTTQDMATGSSWISTGRTLSLSKGVWNIEGTIAFASNSTGRRGAAVYNGSAVEFTSEHTEQAISGAITRVATSNTVTLTGSATVAIYGFQTSGGPLSCETHIKATRIA